jgi:hypothetical protein
MSDRQKRYRGRTDRELIIDWLKADLKYYQNHIGEVTENGVLIDEKLIETVKSRIKTNINKL